MEKDFLIELTSELYRVTLLFPKKEPLRYKMRDLGTDIFAHLIFLLPVKASPGNNPEVLRGSREKIFEEIKKELAILDGYFELAKAQNWISPKDLISIKNKYYKIEEGLKGLGIQKERSEVMPSTPQLKRRHSQILEILTKKGRAQVGELKKDFPGVTKRTLRRDFEHLLKQGLVERKGEGKETFYQAPMINTRR